MDFSHDDAIRASLLFGQHLKTNVDQTVKDFQQLHRAFFQTLGEIISKFVSVEFCSRKE
jgi:hypothetical protein